MRLSRDFWWLDWCIVVDSVGTLVLWSGRAVGIQGFGTEEENLQTFVWNRVVC